MKRIISFVLCLSMLFSMLPVHAFAADAEDGSAIDSTLPTEVTQSTEELPETTGSPTETGPQANVPEDPDNPAVQALEETIPPETEETVLTEETTFPTEETEETLTSETTLSESQDYMTGEELLAAAEAAGGWYILQEAAVIDSEITIPESTAIFVYAPATLTVTGNGALTVDGSLGVANGGTMTVDAGCTVTVNGSLSIGGGTVVTVDGNLINNHWVDVNYGSLVVNGSYTAAENTHSAVDFYGSVSGDGIDKSLFTIYNYVYDEASLLDALIPREGYKSQAIYVVNYDTDKDGASEPLVLTQSITIPEDFSVVIGYFTGETARMELARGVTVTNNSIFQLTSYGILALGYESKLINNGTVSNNGIITGFGTYEENGTFFNKAPELLEYITQEELLQAMASDDSSEYTTSSIILVTEDLTIPAGENVIVENPGYVEVLSGATLTLEGVMDFPGSSLTVRDGGSLTMPVNSYLGFYGGSALTIEDGASYSVDENATIYANLGTALTGITKGEVCNSNLLMDPADNLQTFAETFGAGYKQFMLSIATDYTVSEDMTIPANILLDHYANTVTIADGATLTIEGGWDVGIYVNEEGVGDVPGHIVVENGTLVINGTLNLLYGSTLKVAEGTGTIIENGTIYGTVESYVKPMTAEELVSAMGEALETQGWYQLTQEVIIDSDVTLPEDCTLTVAEGGKITVTENGYLTFGFMFIDGGSVEVKAGGMLYSLRMIHAESGSLIVADGSCYYSDYGYLYISSSTTFSGFDPSMIHYVAEVNTEAELRTALTNDAGYLEVEAIILSSITLTEDLTVPEGVYMAVGVNILPEPGDWDFEEPEISVFLTVPKGITLTNNGQIGINNIGSMTVDGTLVNHGSFFHQLQLTVNGTHIEEPVDEYGMDGAVTYGKTAVRPEENMTQADLEAAIANGEGADLRGKYISITDDLTLNTSLYYDQNSIITVKSGATLTLTETATCYGASLYVEDGAKLKLANGANLHVTWGILSIADGAELILESGCGIVSDGNSRLTNVENSQIIHTYYVHDEAGLLEAIGQDTYAGADIWITEFQTIELTADLVIPENVTIRMLNSNTLLVPSGVVVVNEGTIFTQYYGALEIAEGGTMINNGTVHASYEGFVKIYGTMMGNDVLVEPDSEDYGTGGTLEGEVTGMSQDAFEEALAEGGAYTLSDSVYLTRDLTIGDDVELTISETLIVSSGVTLTLNCETHVSDGVLVVQEDAKVISNAGFRVRDVSEVTISGSMESNFFMGISGDSHVYANVLTLNSSVWLSDNAVLEIGSALTMNPVDPDSDWSYTELFDSAKLIIGPNATLYQYDWISNGGGTILIQGTLSEDSNSYISNWTQTNEFGTVEGYPVEKLFLNAFVWSMDDLHALIAEFQTEKYASASANADDGAEIRISEDFTLPNQVTINLPVSGSPRSAVLTVEEGVTFTVEGYLFIYDGGTLENYGTLEVKNQVLILGSSAICNYGALRVYPGASLVMLGNGTYEGNNIQVVCENGSLGGVHNFDMSIQSLYSQCASDAELRSAIAQASTSEYAEVLLVPTADITLSADLMIPNGVSLIMNGGVPEDDEKEICALSDGSVSITVPAGTALINDGIIEVGPDAAITVAGQLENRRSLSVAENGTLTLEESAQLDNYYGELVVFGSLTQSGSAIYNYNGSVQISEEYRNIADSQLVNHLAGGSFGAVEGYPAEYLYAQCCPESVDDIQALIDEYQAGDYAGGIVLVKSAFTVDGTVTLPEGIRMVVSGADARLCIEPDAFLSVQPGAELIVENGGTVENNAYLDILGKMTVQDGSAVRNNVGINCGVYGTITAEEGSITGPGSVCCYYTPEEGCGSVTGVDSQSIYLMCETITSEEELLGLLEHLAESGFSAASIPLHESITLTKELVLPEGSAIFLQSDSDTITFTVSEEAQVINHGDFFVSENAELIIDGRWLGNLPVADDEDAVSGMPMTEEAFLALLAEAAETGFPAELNQTVILSRDLVLSQNLIINPGAKLIVPAGARLTNQDILNIFGSLILDEGAEFVNDGSVFALEGSRIQAADGTYLSEPAEGSLCCVCDSEDSVTGISSKFITLYRDCYSFDELVDALTLADKDGFGWSWLFLRDSMEISSTELVIPETCMLVIMPLMQYGGGYDEITVHIPETTTVVNNGLVQVGMYATLTVDGQWNGNAPMNTGGTIGGDFFTFTEEEFADLIAAGSGTIPSDLILTKDITIPTGCAVTVNGYGTITVSEGATLTVEGQLILADNASLIVEGLLVNNGQISVRDNAVLNAEGASVMALFTLEQDTASAHYIHGENATIEAVYWGNGEASTAPTLMGISTADTTVVVTGSSEPFIRSIVEEVSLTDEAPKALRILVEEDLTLTESLQLPSYATLNVSGANLTVPSGVTLSNSGQTLVQENSKLEVQGNLTGNLPKLESDSSEFVYEGSDISYSQDTLEAQLAQSALTGETVVLSLPLTLTQDLEIPEKASLVLSGAAITVPADRILSNFGKLCVEQGGSITVKIGAALENSGSITVQKNGILDVIEGSYVHNETGILYLVTPTGIILGNAYDFATHVVLVGSESDIRSALELANLQALEIRLTGNAVLTEDLVIPEYAVLIIENGTLTVPADRTLTNNGTIQLGRKGLLNVEQGGTLIGNQPTVIDASGEYVNESVYEQSYLEDLLADAIQNEQVLLDVPVRITGELSVDQVNLTISGEGVYLILEDGAELTNNYFLYCENGGGIVSNGGTLVNNRGIYAQYGGVLDMTGGSYEGSGSVYNKSSCDEEGNVTHGTVLGVGQDNIVIQAETYSDDQIIRDTIAYVDSLVESGMIANPEWGGFFSIRFVGDTTLSADLELPYYSDPIITASGSLTVPEGMTLTDHSGMRVAGTLTANGQVVATGFPFLVDSEDCLVNPENCTNYYFDDLKLEDITVTPSQTTACVDQSIELVVDSWYPVQAKYFGDYEVSFAPVDFDGYGWNEDGNLIVYTNNGPCEVTVTITATDEYGAVLTNSEGTVIAKSVTLNFVNQEINMFCEGLPDFYENGQFGIYAGNSIEMFANFTGVEADRDAAFQWDTPELDPEIGTWNCAEGVLTITVSEDLTTHETVQVIVRHPENAELYASTTLHLRPKASSVDVALNEQIVTGETVLFDLNRDGTSAKLIPVTTPAGALCENGYNAAYTQRLVQWSTSNKNVATVDNYGNVSFTGKAGTAKITVKTNFGSSASSVVTFNVVALAQEIVSSASNVTALIGGSSATYTVYDPSISETALKNTTVEWFLCDKDGNAIESHPYAAISAKGKLTTKTVSDETKVYLMARVIGDENSAALSEPVLVKLYPAITSVQILDELGNALNGQTLMHDTLKDGDTFSLYAAVAPYYNAVKSIVWGPVKNSVATIDAESGLVTVLKPGTVKFTLTVTTLNNKKTTANVTMKFGIFTQDLALSATMPDGSLAHSMDNLTVYGGESITFSAVPENAEGGDTVTTGGVKWALSDKAGGSVSGKGVLKTKAVANPLTVTVTVTSTDGNCSRQIPVTLLPKPVTAENGETMDALVIRSDYGYITKTTQTIGAEEGFTVSAVDARTGEAVDVTWSSSKKQFATIGEIDGVIQPVDKGTTTITATDSFGRTASFTLKVNKLSKSVAIAIKGDAEPVIASGKALTLVGTVTYSNNSTDKKVTWSMTDESGNAVPKTVATLSSSGKLTAAKGLTSATVVLIRADAKDGNPSAYAVQAVTLLPAATGVEVYGPFGSGRDVDITNTTQKVDLTYGDTLQLSATVYPYYGDVAPMNAQNAMQGVTWKSSNAKIAAIDPDTGIVQCLKAGTVTITATANDGSGKKATFKLTVHKSVDSLTLPATAFIGGGKSLSIPYTIDEKATNKALNWTMVLADETGAPLTDAYGKELAVAKTLATLSKGTLKTKAVTAPQYLLVRAETTDGSKKTAQCFVTIYPVISGIALYDAAGQAVSSTETLPASQSFVFSVRSKNSGTASAYLSAQDIWTVTSAKPAVAEVSFNENGEIVVSAVCNAEGTYATGSAKITVKANDGSGKSASFTVKFTN